MNPYEINIMVPLLVTFSLITSYIIYTVTKLKKEENEKAKQEKEARLLQAKRRTELWWANLRYYIYECKKCGKDVAPTLVSGNKWRFKCRCGNQFYKNLNQNL